MIFKSYLWYPDIYVWVSGVGWWGMVISHSTGPPPHHPPPKFKSYLWYPDIYVWVSGVRWWGVYKNGKKNLQIQNWMLSNPQHLSHIYDTLTIYFWVLGVGSHHVYKLNFNKYIILIKIIFHFYFFQNKAVPSADM